LTGKVKFRELVIAGAGWSEFEGGEGGGKIVRKERNLIFRKL
jgi:hypothetical protein